MDLSNFSIEISLDSTLESVDVPCNVETEKTERKPDEYVDQIARVYLRHNFTLACLEDVMKLINERPDECVKLPTGKNQILDLFHEHRDVVDIFYFVQCGQCTKTNKIHSNDKKVKCLYCDELLKTSETNFFVIMPIESQIVKSIKDNWSYISEFSKRTDKQSTSYSDAYDGSILRNVLNLYSDSDVNVLSLCLNVDGANKHKSNSLSVWPIQLIQNYLPPEIRFLPHNIIVSGLYYSDSESDIKLNFHNYLLPLVEELMIFDKEKVNINIQDRYYKFKPVITHCAVDLPAKSKVQETKQHGGYYACTYCEIPGELILLENLSDPRKKPKKNLTKKPEMLPQKEPEKKLKTCVRYVNGSYKIRDERETLEKMLAASTLKESIDGVKDVSCLVGLEHFNIIWSFGIEYLHCCLQAVTKRFFEFLFNSKYCGKNYYIAPRQRMVLNKKILRIKPTSNIVRKPRSLQQRSNFKASEYRSMLLYYLPVCLPGHMPNVYVKHIRLFSAAVYILLKDNISSKEVDEAEKMLLLFVGQHQELFGKCNMVMVIHLLQHLAESVRHLGPLWSQSAFPFERNNGCLLKLANGTTDVLHQMSSKYALKKSLESKKTEIKNKILLGKSVNITETESHVLNCVSFEILDFSNVSLCVYKRVRIKNIIFTSLLYTRPKRSIDYFIGLKNGTLGTAKYYFDFNKKTYVMIRQFEVIDNIYHIIKVHLTKRMTMSPINEIEKKYLFMNIGLNHYIVSIPNPYENE